MSYWSPILSLQFQNPISSENQVIFLGKILVIKPDLILIHLVEKSDLNGHEITCNLYLLYLV